MVKPSNIARKEALIDFIKKVGPWAFHSYDRAYWPRLSDRQIIEGALLHAPEAFKLKLPQLYSMKQIHEVWRNYVVIQFEHHKYANLWAARNLFGASDPDDYVRQEFSKSQERRLREGVSF